MKLKNLVTDASFRVITSVRGDFRRRRDCHRTIHAAFPHSGLPVYLFFLIDFALPYIVLQRETRQTH